MARRGGSVKRRRRASLNLRCRARLSRSRQQNVVLLVDVAVEILLEGLQRVEERSVGVAERGLAIVVAAQDPQGAERAPERRVLGFVLLEHELFDGATRLVGGDAGREQLVLLAGQVRLQLASDLAEATLSVAEPRLAVAVNPDHGGKQALDPGEGLTQAVVVHRDDVGAQLRRFDLTPVAVLDAGALQATLVDRLEGGEDLLELESAFGAGRGQGLVPAAAIVETQLLEQLRPGGALSDQFAERGAWIYEAVDASSKRSTSWGGLGHRPHCGPGKGLALRWSGRQPHSQLAAGVVDCLVERAGRRIQAGGEGLGGGFLDRQGEQDLALVGRQVGRDQAPDRARPAHVPRRVARGRRRRPCQTATALSPWGPRGCGRADGGSRPAPRRWRTVVPRW